MKDKNYGALRKHNSISGKADRNFNCYMQGLISLILILLPILTSAKTIHVNGRIPLANQLRHPNSTYIVNDIAFLHGDSIWLPKNSILKFTDNGKFENGVIIGNSSKIESSNHLIFDDIEVLGTWINKLVYSDWVKFPTDSSESNQSFENLMTLCNGPSMTDLYMSPDKHYVSSSYRSAPIKVPSNIYWHNEAEIIMIPNDLEWYNMVLIDKSENVTIEGGVFVGDLEEHLGSTGEWGHGIKCGGASNVTLKNLTCLNHWGDGIDLIEGKDENGNILIDCNNIQIINVRCLYNRRQGMSIEAAHHILVLDSEFAFTGSYRSTPPSAGIDIEPWTSDLKVSDVNFRNCLMHDNKGWDFQCEPNIQDRDNNCIFRNDIILESCIIGGMRVQFTNGLKLNGCMINEKFFLRNSQNIDVQRSTISELEEGKGVIDFKCIDCDIKLTKSSNNLAKGGIIAGLSFLALGFCKKRYFHK